MGGQSDYRERALVIISTFAGGISNSGTISAGAYGIVVGGTAGSGGSVTISTFSGGISNTGTISAGGSGILLGGAPPSGPAPATWRR